MISITFLWIDNNKIISQTILEWSHPLSENKIYGDTDAVSLESVSLISATNKAFSNVRK